MGTDDSQVGTPSRFERFRERRRDRKQRRQWRRERRRGVVNPYDAVNRAESSQYKGGFFKKD
jgi:hypothetical protein